MLTSMLLLIATTAAIEIAKADLGHCFTVGAACLDRVGHVGEQFLDQLAICVNSQDLITKLM